MMSSYKFWYITRDDAGFILECAVRFYEGDVSTQQEMTIFGMDDVTRYRVTNRLSGNDLSHVGGDIAQELSGEDVVKYNRTHFGEIKTHDELCAFVNVEMAKDPSRTPIPEQSVTDQIDPLQDPIGPVNPS